MENRLLALAPSLSLAADTKNRLLALVTRLSLPVGMENCLLALVTRLSLAADTENRLLALVTGLSLAVGLVFGVIAGTLFFTGFAAPDNTVVHLDLPEQDDFIIAVAEAYAGDRDTQLARDRLARLRSGDIAARVEDLATQYVPQRDLIAAQLAGLAVVLGSQNATLIALNMVAGPAIIAPQGALSQPQLVSRGYSQSQLPGEKPKGQGGGNGVGGGSAPAAANTVASNLTPAALRPTQASSPNASTSPTLPKGNGGGSVTPPAVPPATATPAQARPTAPPDQVAASSDLPPKRVRTATPVPVSIAKPNAAKPPPSTPSPVVSTVAVSMPDYVGAPALSIPLNAPPSKCTSPSQMPPVVDRTIALCANQEYKPFIVSGDNLTVYGDAGGSALIRAPGRAFGITVNGSNITISGVHIVADTDPADLNTWMCLYEECSYKGGLVHGAFYYGGGILLDHTTNVAVVSSTVSNGAIGVASVHGSNNKIVNNNLSNLNGWGAFLYFTDHNAVVGNTMNHVTRGCMGIDGTSFTTGCESAGIAAIRAETNLVVSNHCEHSSNCVYASGEKQYGSNNNKFFNNYCAASPHNCYEITFASGNQFDYNVATSDPDTGDKCTYPFWISGSNVYFGKHNTWNCKFSAKQAYSDSRQATTASTGANGF